VAFTNFETKDIHCKVIYFGAPSSGKSENLRSIFNQTSAEIKSGLLELRQEDGSTRYFDFLPLSIGELGEFHLKLHLFTLPVSSLYESTASVILNGVDGVVFIADSRPECLIENTDALAKCHRLLRDEGYNINDLPFVIQYNKRDLPGVMPTEILRREINRSGYPETEASALQGVGTLESLEAIIKQVVDRLEKGHEHPSQSGASHDNTDSLSY
jgi:signal recognition particle receptor subunit beta